MDEFGLAAAASARVRTVSDFAASELFDRTFMEGMRLVEETATYLDGEGRQESKQLSRDAALAYAGESMRLTTRLMQLASWLLVQRAVREGDMAPAEACESRYRLKTDTKFVRETEGMPEGLIALADRAERLFERVLHLDRRMYVDGPDAEQPNPVQSQFDRLRSAFPDSLAG